MPAGLVKFALAGKDLWQRFDRLRAGLETHPFRPCPGAPRTGRRGLGISDAIAAVPSATACCCRSAAHERQRFWRAARSADDAREGEISAAPKTSRLSMT